MESRSREELARAFYAALATGGGLGLLHAADIVVAADEARFALGYGALGLTADGGNT
jgi:enoyl-CoA hydratase/carnithine racemase